MGTDVKSGKGGVGQHMRSVHTSAVEGDCLVSSSGSVDSFFKGARKISVGDCALFKPPLELPPFIGIIRWLTFKGEYLHLGVNWLYRPAEVKLGKGILLDAAPNEVFYSFHKDEIPDASLLHPCKVAFLPKGVAHSQGIPSFICRRVYDIAKERLWWLTDQNYIDESQEEVDKLLFRTQKEMHATVQSGGQSPKPVNGPIISPQLKSGSDSVQNSVTSFSSHNKRRKRDHSDHGSEPGKRSSKTDDGDSVQFKAENTLKSSIANITEKGGLVNTEGVEKLLQLMQPDKPEKKMDLTSRSMLADVIAMTDKFDCLCQFVQLKGLLVFDEWLQDIHKGKIGGSTSSKGGDKSVEDFLFVLLRALEKLPVNLHALRTCNIGRSVNHLRTQKNVDIQRKSRGLVDTWKKRVEAEMNIIDSKSGAGQAGSNSGNRNPGGSFDTLPKKSDLQISASKSTSVNISQGDCGTKSASSSPGAMKSSALSQGSGKDGQRRISAGSASDLPLTPAREEEKSSSSSPSRNYSQSLSGRENARSSTAGSNRSIFLNRDLSTEKFSSLTCEKAVDVPIEETKKLKLTLRIRNRVCSPVQSASGGLCDDISIMNIRASSPILSDKPDQFDQIMKEKNDSCRVNVLRIRSRVCSPVQSASGGLCDDISIMNIRALSPVLSDKPDQFDQNMKEKNDSCPANVTSDVNTESWQSHDFKDVLTGSDEVDVLPAAICDENRSRVFDDTRKVAEVLKAASSLSGNLQEASLNSINTLIESCVKYSEGKTSLLSGDDDGMNLLASVATGEISKSDLVSPTDSPQRNLLENSCTGSESNSRSTARDIYRSVSAIMADVEEKKANSITGCEVLLADNKKGLNDGYRNGVHFEQKQLVAATKINNADLTDKETIYSSGACKKLLNEDHGELNAVKADGTESWVSISQSEGPVQDTHITETWESACLDSAVTDQKSECTRENVGSREALGECSAEVVSHKASPALFSQEMKQQMNLTELKPTGNAIEEKERICTAVNTSNSNLGTPGVDVKLKFDLNEGLDVEDGNLGETKNLPFPFSVVSCGLPASITVTAAAKGAFVPQEDLLRSRVELGWKGSAATSAFHPAEPRKCLEMPLGLSSLPLPNVTRNKNEPPAFDFDLNVTDERILEDISAEESMLGAVSLSNLKNNSDIGRKEQPSPPGRSSGGFDLDLNRVDDANEVWHSQLSNSKYRQEPSLLPIKSTSSIRLSNREIERDFDLNDGPVLNDCSEAVTSNQHARGSVQFQLPVGGIRMNTAELGNFSAWFHPGSTYSPVHVSVPSVFHDRVDNKSFSIGTNQRIVGPPSGCTPDIYQGSVLSPSPALPFSSTPFKYPVFPFGPTFPVASANLSGVPTPYMDASSSGRIPYTIFNPQFLGRAASVSSHAQRPCNGGEENSRISGRQGLDLNAGPGGLNRESKDEILPVASRQFMAAGSQATSEEQQSRMCQLVGGVLKRKEPDGRWDAENFRNRQSSWL